MARPSVVVGSRKAGGPATAISSSCSSEGSAPSHAAAPPSPAFLTAGAATHGATARGTKDSSA
eukprot:6192341-Alexandrium_andersonii.AAC.1